MQTLWKRTFRLHYRKSKTYQDAKQHLHTRAWLSHMLFNIAKTMFLATGGLSPRQEEESSQCTTESDGVNREVASTVFMFAFVMTVAGLIAAIGLDIAIGFRRHCASAIVYLELANLAIFALCAADHGDLQLVVTPAAIILLILLFSCDPVPNTIVALLVQLLISFGLEQIVRKDQFTPLAVSMKLLGAVITGLLLMVTCMTFTKLTTEERDGRKESLGKGTAELDQEMLKFVKESVIVVSDEDQKIKYANGAACSLSAKIAAKSAIVGAKSESVLFTRQKSVHEEIIDLQEMDKILSLKVLQQHGMSDLSALQRDLVSLEEIISQLKDSGDGESRDNLYSIGCSGDEERDFPDSTGGSSRNKTKQLKFFTIQTQRVKFAGASATAVFCQNMTSRVKHLLLKRQVSKEKTQQLNLKNFRSTICHEFRTPVATSIMFLENLLKSQRSPEDIRIIRVVIAQLHMLYGIADGFLELRVIESGRFKRKQKRFELKSVLELVTHIFQLQAETNQTQISYEIYNKRKLDPEFSISSMRKAKAVPRVLMGDEARLQQVLINLVKNSIKFTVGGSVRIIAGFDQKENELLVRVVDTGKGIKEQDIGKLFHLFGKLEHTAEMNTEGIGMGLLICKNLVQLNGGEIWVESEGEDRGTRFNFTMKMQDASCLQDQSEQSHELLLSPAEAEIGIQEESRESNFGLLDRARLPVSRSGQLLREDRLGEDSPSPLLGKNQKDQAIPLRKPLVFRSQPQAIQNQASQERRSEEAKQVQGFHRDVLSNMLDIQTIGSSVESDSLSHASETINELQQIRPILEDGGEHNSSQSESEEGKQSQLSEGQQINAQAQDAFENEQPLDAQIKDWILIVDDDPFNILATQTMLVSLSIPINTIDTAANGNEATSQVKRRLDQGRPMYKLILMDYSMPECDGPTACRHIVQLLREHGKSAAQYPAICCTTAYQEEQYRQIAFDSGMTHYMTKPIDNDRLRQLLVTQGLIPNV